MRTSSEQLERVAIDALAEVCQEIGLELQTGAAKSHELVLMLPSGQRLPLEVKARAVASALDVPTPRADRAVVVVADVVTAPVRAALRERGVGWLDRRGHLRLEAPGLLVETDVMPLPRHTHQPDEVPHDAFGRGRATIEVALALLLAPEDPPGVRELAREVDLASSTVSQARDRLQRASLVTAEGHPLVPELFWELAERWRPRWQPLASDPADGPPVALGFVDGGWVRAGDLAAATLGAPLAVTSEAPEHYYVKDPSVVRQARRILGDAEPDRAACRIAAAPSHLVHRRALPSSTSSAADVVAVAPSVVVALDLARDPSRGREILARWTQTTDGRPAVWQT